MKEYVWRPEHKGVSPILVFILVQLLTHNPDASALNGLRAWRNNSIFGSDILDQTMPWAITLVQPLHVLSLNLDNARDLKTISFEL